MSAEIINKYAAQFPAKKDLIESFQVHFEQKLWNELSIAILQLLFSSQAKGKVGFDFYSEFVKKFQKNIDPIKLLKIIKEVIVSLPNSERLAFLKEFEQKQAFTQQTKTIVQALQGSVYVHENFDLCFDLITKIEKTLTARKDVDQLVYSSFYEFCMGFYHKKNKYKQFYTSALQYLAYTPAEELEENQKVQMLVQMGVAALISDEIYNFSELLEQPSLVSLKNSKENWMYQLLQYFNQGDIVAYEKFDLNKRELLKKNSKTLQSKIRLMAFLELVFNLPKSDRVLKFGLIANQCAIPENHVEFMVMKAMALNLVKGSIDQLTQEVTITWIAPKVLESQRIGVMLKKFEEWDAGVMNVQTMVRQSMIKV